jgi:amino acid transporter
MNPFKPEIPNLDVHSLDELEKRRIFSRNDSRYIRYLFKSRWQPLFAYIGIIGCGIVILFSGFPALFILGARSSLTNVSNLKKAEALVWDVIGAYFGVRRLSFSGARSCPSLKLTHSQPLLFLCLYFVYKYGYPRTEAVDIRDLTLSTYLFPADMSEIELHNQNTADAAKNQSPIEQQPRPDVSLAEAQNILISNRLEARKKRMWRGILRELWSFVVTDKAEEI